MSLGTCACLCACVLVYECVYTILFCTFVMYYVCVMGHFAIYLYIDTTATEAPVGAVSVCVYTLSVQK